MSKQARLGGTHGKILHVDLTTATTEVEIPDVQIFRKLVGGRALVAYLLLRDSPPQCDPLGPENLLVFAPGILQGTGLPGSGRHGLGAKSPLTGALGSSEAGGWWGDEFKRAGFDALVVHGKAKQPVYLWINDGQVEIRPALHLWGRETGETETLVRQELGDDRIRVAQIGIAGENLCRYAAIMNDVNRAAGRTGMGAVMGSKHLKAIAVRGTAAPPVADRKRIREVSKWLAQNYRDKAGWAVEMGTPIAVKGLAAIGGLPTRAFRDPVFERWQEISGERMQETLLKERDTCAVCPIRCKQVVDHHDLQERFYIDPVYGGPEYEALAALGSNCCVDDLPAIAKANERCAAYGLDVISAGAMIAFVMECVERGLLTSDNSGGYLPSWGDPQALLDGIELIAERKGFGDKMANGVMRLAHEIGGGAEEFALHVKGQELPMHEPRFKAALGFGYAVAPVGADHMMNIHDAHYCNQGDAIERVNSVYDVGPLPLHDLGEQKLNLFYHEARWKHFHDCALVCMFYPYRYEHMSEALSGATGVEYSVEDVLAVGERAQTLARLFNVREGFSRADDQIPRRVMKAFDEGPLSGVEISSESFDWALNRYYELMGWDPGTGSPTMDRLETLGLIELLTDSALDVGAEAAAQLPE